MMVENAHIYKYIKDYINEIPLINAKKGQLISNAFDRDSQIYYIINGQIKVETMSNTGKKILVDTISENEFAGQISYMRNTNLYCDSIASTDVELLCLKDEMMNKLMKNSEFSTVFYYKTSNRIYKMYKKMLSNNLFSQCELVSYYILDQSCMGKFIYKSIYDICENLNISRRNLYNILNNFEKKGIIEKEKNGVFIIKDMYYLRDNSANVKMFLENQF